MIPPPVDDITKAVIAIPPPEAFRFIERYAELCAWLKVHNRSSAHVYGAVSMYARQWPLCASSLISHYLVTTHQRVNVLRPRITVNWTGGSS